MWVLDYLDDLESDFSVFHRVEDIHSLPGPRFFKLAFRVSAYSGVMAARQMAQEEETTARHGGERPVEVPLAAVAAQHSDWIEVSRGG